LQTNGSIVNPWNRRTPHFGEWASLLPLLERSAANRLSDDSWA
jgi:hypothetical protein